MGPGASKQATGHTARDPPLGPRIGECDGVSAFTRILILLTTEGLLASDDLDVCSEGISGLAFAQGPVANCAEALGEVVGFDYGCHVSLQPRSG